MVLQMLISILGYVLWLNALIYKWMNANVMLKISIFGKLIQPPLLVFLDRNINIVDWSNAKAEGSSVV